MWFNKQQRLVEQELRNLSLALLHHLQGALTAKLILVNEELQNRYETLPEFAESVAEVKGNNEALETMLERGFKSPYEIQISN